MSNDSIFFKNETMVETQFIVFYDLRVKIINGPTNHYITENIHPFLLKDKKNSELNKFYFSDNYADRLVVSHLHANDDHDEINSIKNNFNKRLNDFDFEFAKNPIGVEGHINSYSWLECTLFHNGILTVVLRVQSLNNNKNFNASRYLKHISRPEYVRDRKTDDPTKGDLINVAWEVFGNLETHICTLLNRLELDVVQLSEGISKRLKVSTQDMKDKPQNAPLPGKKHTTPHYLQRSRPYIGTFIKLIDNTETPDNEQMLMRFAVACARTTPEFLMTFREPEKYLHDKHTMRNIYFPGKNIVFIARRGWVCIQREEMNNQKAFLLGVVEMVLFIIQANLSSVRAIRRYAQELIEESKKVSDQLYHDNKSKKTNKAHLKNFSYRFIQKCSEFVTRARLSSPAYDISSLLDSHINTHTGIAAANRLKQLTFHDDLKTKVNDILKNYDDFLEQAKHYWLKKIVSSLAIGGLIAIIGVIVAVLPFIY